MSSSREKGNLQSRLVPYLIAFSALLLISSSLSLIEFHETSFIPKSVLQLILVNKTSVVDPILKARTVSLIAPSINPLFDNVVVSPMPQTKAYSRSPVFDNLAPEILVNAMPVVSPMVKSKTDSQNGSSTSPVLDNVASETNDRTISPVFHNVASEKQGNTNQFVPDRFSSLKSCDKSRARLRVYMYDLPPKFHFGMLGWEGSANETWPSVNNEKSIPRYPGGLNLQHSPEYWLTIDLLASNTETVVRTCSAIRVLNSSEADIIFVPFFSSLSYNRHSKSHAKRKASVDRLLQEELVRYLQGREEWRRKGGSDHLVVAHHPNSMLIARKSLGSCMFVLSDFGRYPAAIANLEKDVIAPYKHMVRTIPAAASAPFDQRPTLVYFQGAIYRKDGGVIRQHLYNLLKNEEDVHFKFGSVGANGVKKVGEGMASSKFCLNIAGDTPSSNRLFDAIASHCVPVIISDEIELPYEDVLDYSEFCLFVHAEDAVQKGYLLHLLRGIKQDEWTKMWETLKKISVHFEYRYPSQDNDAVDMIWQTIARKKQSSLLSIHRENRYRYRYRYSKSRSQ